MITGNIHPDNRSGALSRPSSPYPAGRHGWRWGRVFLRYGNFIVGRKKWKIKTNQHTWDSKFPTRIVKEFFYSFALFKHFIRVEYSTSRACHFFVPFSWSPSSIRPNRKRKRTIVFVASSNSGQPDNTLSCITVSSSTPYKFSSNFPPRMSTTNNTDPVFIYHPVGIIRTKLRAPRCTLVPRGLRTRENTFPFSVRAVRRSRKTRGHWLRQDDPPPPDECADRGGGGGWLSRGGRARKRDNGVDTASERGEWWRARNAWNLQHPSCGGRRHGEQSKSTCYLGYWTLSPLSLTTSTLTKPRIKRFGVFRPCLRMSTLWNQGER